MKRALFTALCALLLTAAAAAKDNLAILPFTGGNGEDGETIAELFSFDEALNEIFSPIPRTSIAGAIRNERNFQMASGMTDPDTIAALGKQLGAQYVVAGNITALGNQNLLVISIIKIDDLRQIAGDFRTYTRIEEIQDKLPDMARNIITAMETDASALPKLAIVPFQMQSGADKRDADVLAQILAIYIVRGGRYAVYPRTSTLEQVQAEYTNQGSGDTADEHMVNIGRGVNPKYVLSGAARRLGSERNMFNASIINLESGVQERGRSVNYETLEDGITVMRDLVDELTGLSETERISRQAEAEATAAEERQARRARIRESSGQKSVSIGLLAGTSFAAPWFTETFVGTIALSPHILLEIGSDIGMIHGYEETDVEYASLYPFGHINIFVPFGEHGGWYGGLGGGAMIAFYTAGGETTAFTNGAMDITTGLYLGKNHRYFTAAYTIRTNFNAVNSRLALGFSYRFE
jgi:TolB-like protein